MIEEGHFTFSESSVMRSRASVRRQEFAGRMSDSFISKASGDSMVRDAELIPWMEFERGNK
eukprot:2611544-Pyramimonas_sp.AAC.1